MFSVGLIAGGLLVAVLAIIPETLIARMTKVRRH
jgi:hypothetical protein